MTLRNDGYLPNNNPEDPYLQQHRCENLKSRNYYAFWYNCMRFVVQKCGGYWRILMMCVIPAGVSWLRDPEDANAMTLRNDGYLPNITTQKTRIFSNIAVRTSNLAIIMRSDIIVWGLRFNNAVDTDWYWRCVWSLRVCRGGCVSASSRRTS